MTYQKLIQSASQEALEKDKEDSAVILLLSHAANIKTNELYQRMFKEVEEEIVQKFKSLFDKYLYENKPVQYLIGTCCFFGYDFIVNPSVLIPRFETEELVENVLKRYDLYFAGQTVDVCDVATGSGCIAISLAKEEPKMNVIGTDISTDALAVAKANNEKLNANVTFLQGNMLEPLQGKKFDILVSNPPYIPTTENVMSLVKDNEPNIALFGGEDGLKFYHIILSGAHQYLKEKAMICFEHGYDKKEEMIELAKKYFPTAKVEVLKDLEGKGRMTFIYIGGFKWEN